MPTLPNIEIRDRRIRGGRLSLAPATDKPRVRAAREEMLRDLIDKERQDIIERIRGRELHIGTVYDKWKSGKLDELRPVVDADLTLGPLVDRQLAIVEGGGVAGTIKAWKSIAAQLLKKFPRETDIRNIASEDIEDFIFGKKANGKPWGAMRQGQSRDFAARVWDIAIRREIELAEKNNARPRITINPWRSLLIAGGKKRDVYRPAFLQRPEWRALEQANEDTPEFALCAVATLAGLREGEIVNLRTDVDVDLAARVIRIQPRKGEFEWYTKSPRSIREVPISRRLHEILTRHVELGFAGERYFFRIRKNVDQPMAEFTAANWCKRAFERAGIKYGRNEGDGLTLHSCRHTFATWLAQEDVQFMKIAALMGDTVETVILYYAHHIPQDLVKAIEVLDTTMLKAA